MALIGMCAEHVWLPRHGGYPLREAGIAAPGSTTTIVATSEVDPRAAGLPSVARAASELAFCDHDAEFAFGVELFIASVRIHVDSPS